VGGGLSTSPQLRAYTPATATPSSMGGLVPLPRDPSPGPARGTRAPIAAEVRDSFRGGLRA